MLEPGEPLPFSGGTGFTGHTSSYNFTLEMAPSGHQATGRWRSRADKPNHRAGSGLPRRGHEGHPGPLATTHFHTGAKAGAPRMRTSCPRSRGPARERTPRLGPAWGLGVCAAATRTVPRPLVVQTGWVTPTGTSP